MRGSSNAVVRFVQSTSCSASSRGTPEHVADHHRRARRCRRPGRGRCARRGGARARGRRQVDDLAHPLGVLDRALRRERPLHERLQPVVARRVLGDHHVRAEVDRIGLPPGAASLSTRMMLRSEEKVSWSRPTAAMSSKRTTDQKPRLVGEVAELAPVQRLLAAQPLEDLVRRPVPPQVEVADVEVGEVGRGRRCSGHRDLRFGRAVPAGGNVSRSGT